MRSDFKKISSKNIENQKSYSEYTKVEEKTFFAGVRPPSLTVFHQFWLPRSFFETTDQGKKRDLEKNPIPKKTLFFEN